VTWTIHVDQDGTQWTDVGCHECGHASWTLWAQIGLEARYDTFVLSCRTCGTARELHLVDQLDLRTHAKGAQN